MFDISWGEFLLIALIVIGPKELPAVLRTVGQWMTKLRRMANEFQGQFQEAIREAEMADLKKEVDDLATQAKSYTNFDPLGDVQKEIEKSIADKPAETAAVNAPQAEGAAAAETPLAAPSAEPAIPVRTPADAAVESAMRAAAELNAAAPEVGLGAPEALTPDAGGDFAAVPPPVTPEITTYAPPAPVVPASPPAEVAMAPPAPAPVVEAAAPPPAPEPAPAAPVATAAPASAHVLPKDDDWPEPATFREPLPAKRTGSAS
jgi:sec-independent protein translocase protein TatB